MNSSDQEPPEGEDFQPVFELFRKFDEAFRADDVGALREAMGDPEYFPNVDLPEELDIGQNVLHHAIYFSSIDLIKALIDAGANVNYQIKDEIPSLFAAILSERDDRIAIMDVLIEAGAVVAQVGYNEWTPLHLAVNMRDIEAIKFLIGKGADPNIRIGEEDGATSPLDDALAMDFDDGVDVLLGAQS